MRSPRVTAFDLGASRVTCGIFAQGTTGRLVWERCAVEPLALEATAREEFWVSEAARALRAIAAREDLRGRVSLSLPGHLTRTKHITAPTVRREHRDKVLAFEAAENLPRPLDELRWDSVVLADDGLDLHAVLAAVKRGPIDALCAAVEQAGLTVNGATPASFSLRQGFRYNHPELTGSHAVIAVGARSTTVALLDGERFGFRTFALGGGAVTQMVADELGLDFARAETLKLEVARERANLPPDALARQAVQRANDVFGAKLQLEVARTIMHLRRQTGTGAPQVIYLTGGGARRVDLATELARKLGVAVERYDALRRVELAGDARAAGADAMADQAGELVGLAAGIVARAAPAVNLLPASVAIAAKARQRRGWLLMAAAVVALGLAWPISVYQRRVEANRQEIARLEAETGPLRTLEARMAEDRARLERTQQRIAELQPADAVRTSWLRFLSDLQNRLGQIEDVWLDELRIDPVAAEPTVQPQVSDDAPRRTATRRVALSGRLLDVANPQSRVSRESEQRAKTLIRRFAESPFVAAIENERFDNRQHGLLRFDFTLVLNAQHPL